MPFRFLYTSSVDLDPESVMFVDYAAQKYAIKGLEEKCKTFLENNMSADNVCTILEHAAKFDRKELVEKCIKIVNGNAKSVFKSEPFLSVSHKILELIVEQTSTTTPLDIYVACKTWAKGQVEQQEGDVSCEKIRDILGGILNKIRFNEMSCEDFVDYIVKERILSSDEVVKNLLDIRERKEKEKTREENIEKEKIQEKSVEKEIHIQRSGTVGRCWSHSGPQDGISFTVSTNVWLTGVDLFLPVQNGDTLTGPLKVFEGQTQVLTTNVTLMVQTGKQFERFTLPTRVRLQAGKVYSLWQRLTGGLSYQGYSCTKNIFVDGVNVTFRDLAVGASDNCTSCTSGQFHGMTLIKG